MPITAISVGSPHPAWAPQPAPGMAFDDELGMFVLGIPDPSPDHLRDLQASARLGVLRHRRIVVLTLELGASLSFTQPYHASLIHRLTRPEAYQPGEHRLLHVHLVNAQTGVVEGMRMSTISLHVTRLLTNIVGEQVAHPLSEQDFLADAADWDATYPTERSVLRASTFSKLGD